MSDFNSFPIHNIKELSEREGTLSWEQKDLKNNLKIILTTDDLLIKDGVQAIDDEFLEWFVKNTCCEFVKTTNYFEEFGKMDLIKYKIIIPKEEPKQEARVFGGKDNKIFWIDKPVQKGHPDYKETPEEAALRLYPKIITDPYNPSEDLLEEERDIFVNGAKWQQKRMYSEEEVESIWKFALYLAEQHDKFGTKNKSNFIRKDVEEFIEQFKKK